MTDIIEAFEVNEREHATYTITLKDESGDAIASADVDSLTLTLYNAADGSIINSRTAQDVLNANNVTFHATTGLLTWAVQILDNVIVDTTLATGMYERHIALFTVTWDSEAKSKKHEVIIDVRNLGKVT